MKIEVTTRNYTASEHLKSVADQKLKKLDKYFGGVDVSVKVCFKKEKNSLTTEVMLDYQNKFVRATATGENAYDTLDLVLPKLEGQIRKHRTRFDKHGFADAYMGKSVYDVQLPETGKVVKEKKFKLSPMTIDEAITEMELLGHSFYVFLDAKTNTVQVLYARNDGDLGLIEPEI